MSTREAATVARRMGRPIKGTEHEVTEKIVEAATALFLAQGYARTNTDDVAAAANCSKRTLYTRFSTKDDLFEEVVRRFVQTRLRDFDFIATSGKSLKERLYDAADRMADGYEDKEALAFRKLMRSESARFPELVRISITMGLEPLVASIAALIDLDEHPAKSEFGSVFLAEQFLSLIQWPISNNLFAGKIEDIEALRRSARRSVDFFMRLYDPASR